MDYYEAPAEGVKAALCPACNQVKPLSAFEQRISKAASIERGYAGNVRVVHEMTKCNACRPKRSAPRDKIPLKVLHNRERAGDLPRGTTEQERAKRAAILKAKQVEAGKVSAFMLHHREDWKIYQAELGNESQAVRMQRYNLQKSKQDKTKPALFAFVMLYNKILGDLTQRMLQLFFTKQSAPKHYWSNDLTQEESDALRRAWDAVPEMEKLYPTRVPRFFDKEPRKKDLPKAVRTKAEILEARKAARRTRRAAIEAATRAAESEELP